MKKKEIHGALGLILLLVVTMIGCNLTSSGGGFANVDVLFTITGDRISHNANEALDYTDPVAGTDYRRLTWFCGNYQGRQRSRVELTFKKSNNTWALDRENYGGGNCG